MRYCPVCDARYQDDVIKFCTKDGTPLVEDEAPNFTALPSDPIAEDDEIGEQTIIRRRPSEPHVSDTQTEPASDAERIVISTDSTPPPSEPRIRPRTQTYYQPPPPQNTVKIVALTIAGTLFVLGCGAMLFWLLSGGRSANNNVSLNLNANQNVNLNTNLGFDSNFNFNVGKNGNTSNLNTNLSVSTIPNSNIGGMNANSKPSPTPRSSPTPRPTPTVSEAPTPEEIVVRPSPQPTGSPRAVPRPTSTTSSNADRPRNVNN